MAQIFQFFSIFGLVLNILISALILWFITAKIFNLKGDFLKVLKIVTLGEIASMLITVIISVIATVPKESVMLTQSTVAAIAINIIILVIVLVAIIGFYTYLIKRFYKVDIKKALIISVMLHITFFILSMIIALIWSAIYFA